MELRLSLNSARPFIGRFMSNEAVLCFSWVQGISHTVTCASEQPRRERVVVVSVVTSER